MGLLGESRGSLLVGSLATPLGELSVSVTYRRLLGFGRPSNTPTYQARPIRTLPRVDSRGSGLNVPGSGINIRTARLSEASSIGSEISSAPPPIHYYSGSPGSYQGHTPGTSIKYGKDVSPAYRRTGLCRTVSNSSTSPCKLEYNN